MPTLTKLLGIALPKFSITHGLIKVRICIPHAHDEASTSFLTASHLSRTRTSCWSGRVQAAGSPQRQISFQWSSQFSDRFFVQASTDAGLANGSSLYYRRRTGHAIRASQVFPVADREPIGLYR